MNLLHNKNAINMQLILDYEILHSITVNFILFDTKILIIFIKI